MYEEKILTKWNTNHQHDGEYVVADPKGHHILWAHLIEQKKKRMSLFVTTFLQYVRFLYCFFKNFKPAFICNTKDEKQFVIVALVLLLIKSSSVFALQYSVTIPKKAFPVK